jgi:hypothetical protein
MQDSLFNQKLTRRTFASVVAAGSLVIGSETGGDWIELFDGHSLNGWRPSEHKNSWTVSDGMLTANGPRSHLFYVGPVHGADFKNFELEVELTTQPDCNSGMYFHTTYQESGFPEKGFEVQVNNTARGDGATWNGRKPARCTDCETCTSNWSRIRSCFEWQWQSGVKTFRFG